MAVSAVQGTYKTQECINGSYEAEYPFKLLTQVTAPAALVDQEDIWAIYEQTRSELRNITRSMGFMVRVGRHWTMLQPAQAYQHALDSALLKVQSGAVSYNEAIPGAVRELADSGLKVVDYASGHRDQVDVAVRRAVMTGVNQINAKYREQSMDYLETDLVEVSAHLGARNIDGPNGWENHAKWQGKVYRWKGHGRHEKKPISNAEDAENIDISPKSAIIKEKMADSGGAALTTIGKIDIEKYKRITPDITTDEVIITDERIAHIRERHPSDYELVRPFLQEALADPDYILNDKKKNTGLILKQNKSIRMICVFKWFCVSILQMILRGSKIQFFLRGISVRTAGTTT